MLTTSQFDLRFRKPLYAAGCGRLQPGVTTMNYFSTITEVVDNPPTNGGSKFSTGTLLAREDYLLFISKSRSVHSVSNTRTQR